MKVKKEATIAVIIGLVLALVVTGTILRARRALQAIKLPNTSILKKKPVSSINPKTNELYLELTTPDNLVVNIPQLTLTGKTLPGTYIAILGEKGEYLIVPSDIGNFSQDVVLVKGANAIKVSIYQNDGKKIEKTLNVVYTTAQLW